MESEMPTEKLDPQAFKNSVIAALDDIGQQTRNVVVQLAQMVIERDEQLAVAEARIAELEKIPAGKEGGTT